MLASLNFLVKFELEEFFAPVTGNGDACIDVVIIDDHHSGPPCQGRMLRNGFDAKCQGEALVADTG